MNPLSKITFMMVDTIRDLPSLEEMKEKMVSNRVEKLPIVNKSFEILGLASLKDIERLI